MPLFSFPSYIFHISYDARDTCNGDQILSVQPPHHRRHNLSTREAAMPYLPLPLPFLLFLSLSLHPPHNPPHNRQQTRIPIPLRPLARSTNSRATTPHERHPPFIPPKAVRDPKRHCHDPNDDDGDDGDVAVPARRDAVFCIFGAGRVEDGDAR